MLPNGWITEHPADHAAGIFRGFTVAPGKEVRETAFAERKEYVIVDQFAYADIDVLTFSNARAVWTAPTGSASSTP